MRLVLVGVALGGMIGCGQRDADGDGFDAPADCDDADPAVHADAFDADGDGVDQNCDGADGLDDDGDGYASVPSGGDDCDDADPDAHPGAVETCDDTDEDCNGVVDDGPDAVLWYRDDDGDGYGRDVEPVLACAQPSGFVAARGDCDDARATTFPAAPELCDQRDNDCDGVVDGPASEGWAWRYFDGDGDGFGNPGQATEGCSAPGPDWVEDDTDCDDEEVDVNPAADELCGDRIDNDCDTAVDDGTAVDAVTWFTDLDGDGFGDDLTATNACARPPGPWRAEGGDCDDARSDVNPAAPEICNLADDDCDALVDDSDPDALTDTFYLDADTDGRGDPLASVQACSAPPGHVALAGDCDDADAAVHAGADEICDGATDEDCDGLVDDLDPSVDRSTGITWWPDADGDSFGRDGGSATSCTPPLGAVLVGGDCRDADPAVNPLGQEICGGVDEDCDGLLGADDDTVDPAGLVPAWLDADEDGAGDAASPAAACAIEPGYADNADDCDDADPTLQGPTSWLADPDADGFGAGAPLPDPPSCVAPGPDTAPASRAIDCAPADPSVHPDAIEVCGDGVDQDCSGTDAPCRAIASFVVGDGPAWGTDPPVYSCVEACALLFGGTEADWHCSTDEMVLDNQAYVDGWGDDQYCSTPMPESFSLEPANDPGYDCGSTGCSYSAYVHDHCGSVNWCWPR